MASNTYGSARTHEEVLRMIEDTPDKIASKLAEYDEKNRAITDRWMGHTGGYYAITPADKNVMTDQTNHLGRLMNLAELKQKLNQERYDIEHPDRIIVPGARQRTDVVRNGFNLSNRFRLSDKLSLTLAADYQRETLEERTDTADSSDLMNTFGVLTRMAALGGPQSAKKREWGANLVFDWKPTSRLNIQAGVRYQNFKGRNIELARQRAARNPWYQYGLGSDSYVTGLMMPYYELADEEDLRLLDGLRRTYNDNFWNQMDKQSDEYKQLNRRFTKKNGYGLDPLIQDDGYDDAWSYTRIYGKADGSFAKKIRLIKIKTHFISCAVSRLFQWSRANLITAKCRLRRKCTAKG